MGRSGYGDGENNTLGLYRQAVERAIWGKRGQAFLREMAAALDAMPVKQLIAGEVVRDSEHVCALGSVALARQLDVSDIDEDNGTDVANAFGIARSLACEVAYMNDEYFSYASPEDRWKYMRAWVAEHLRATPTSGEDGGAA